MPPPSAGMLGADLESMGTLGDQLDTTTGEIEGVIAEAERVTRTVVDDMTRAFQAAVTEINSTMETLNTSVRAMVSQTDVTQWTGRNADTFTEASQQFNSSCEQITDQTTTAYEEFDSHAAALSATLEEFQGSLTTNLTSASDSTISMSSAVAAQADALDLTMNSGMSFGG